MDPLDSKVYTHVSASDRETIELGRKLASLLKEGDVVALTGELGSGKTWLTKGIALGLGVSAQTVVTSPSFALVNEYEGRYPFFHMDLYRLGSASEFVSAGLEEYLYSGALVVMEWADRFPEILPAHAVTLTLRIIDDHRRRITLSGDHLRALEIIHEMKRKTVKE